MRLGSGVSWPQYSHSSSKHAMTASPALKYSRMAGRGRSREWWLRWDSSHSSSSGGRSIEWETRCICRVVSTSSFSDGSVGAGKESKDCGDSAGARPLRSVSYTQSDAADEEDSVDL